MKSNYSHTYSSVTKPTSIVIITLLTKSYSNWITSELLNKGYEVKLTNVPHAEDVLSYTLMLTLSKDDAAIDSVGADILEIVNKNKIMFYSYNITTYNPNSTTISSLCIAGNIVIHSGIKEEPKDKDLN